MLVRLLRSLFGWPKGTIRRCEWVQVGHTGAVGYFENRTSQFVCTCVLPLSLRPKFGRITRGTCWDCGGAVA